MKILCVFPSGRMIDRTSIGEFKAREFAEEFPSLIYTYI